MGIEKISQVGLLTLIIWPLQHTFFFLYLSFLREAANKKVIFLRTVPLRPYPPSLELNGSRNFFNQLKNSHNNSYFLWLPFRKAGKKGIFLMAGPLRPYPNPSDLMTIGFFVILSIAGKGF